MTLDNPMYSFDGGFARYTVFRKAYNEYYLLPNDNVSHITLMSPTHALRYISDNWENCTPAYGKTLSEVKKQIKADCLVYEIEKRK